jgi:hypothetical protein
MTTHHELWIASRAWMQLRERELAEMRNMAMLKHELAARQMTAPQSEQALARMRRTPALSPAIFAAGALHRISALLLSIGRELDCRADRLLARARSERWDESLTTPC